MYIISQYFIIHAVIHQLPSWNWKVKIQVPQSYMFLFKFKVYFYKNRIYFKAYHHTELNHLTTEWHKQTSNIQFCTSWMCKIWQQFNFNPFRMNPKYTCFHSFSFHHTNTEYTHLICSLTSNFSCFSKDVSWNDSKRFYQAKSRQ
jgi:hypothetical protein